jgi:hypothetical protein
MLFLVYMLIIHIDLKTDNFLLFTLQLVFILFILGMNAALVPAILKSRKKYKEYDFHELAKKVGVEGGYSERY